MSQPSPAGDLGWDSVFSLRFLSTLEKSGRNIKEQQHQATIELNGKTVVVKPRKAWLKEDLIVEMGNRIKNLEKEVGQRIKFEVFWQNKYSELARQLKYITGE